MNRTSNFDLYILFLVPTRPKKYAKEHGPTRSI